MCTEVICGKRGGGKGPPKGQEEEENAGKECLLSIKKKIELT